MPPPQSRLMALTGELRNCIYEALKNDIAVSYLQNGKLMPTITIKEASAESLDAEVYRHPLTQVSKQTRKEFLSYVRKNILKQADLRTTIFNLDFSSLMSFLSQHLGDERDHTPVNIGLAVHIPRLNDSEVVWDSAWRNLYSYFDQRRSATNSGLKTFERLPGDRYYEHHLASAGRLDYDVFVRKYEQRFVPDFLRGGKPNFERELYSGLFIDDLRRDVEWEELAEMYDARLKLQARPPPSEPCAMRPAKEEPKSGAKGMMRKRRRLDAARSYKALEEEAGDKVANKDWTEGHGRSQYEYMLHKLSSFHFEVTTHDVAEGEE